MSFTLLVHLCIIVLVTNSFKLGFQSKILISRRQTSLHAVKIALTREKETNQKLRELLNGLECHEIPCITFEKTEEFDNLKDLIPTHELIVLTSPQSSEIFLESWNSIGSPDVKIVSIGKGTSAPLIKEGIQPVFEPSDATGCALATEMPKDIGNSILYPVSALADTALQSELEKEGFQVTRINTYTTIAVQWTEEEINHAKNMDIVTLASPSAVKIWAEQVGNNQVAVTIGPTSEKAARSAGFSKVFSPPEGSKGIETWAKLIKTVAGNVDMDEL